MNMKKSISILMAVFIVSLSVSAQTWNLPIRMQRRKPNNFSHGY